MSAETGEQCFVGNRDHLSQTSQILEDFEKLLLVSNWLSHFQWLK